MESIVLTSLIRQVSFRKVSFTETSILLLAFCPIFFTFISDKDWLLPFLIEHESLILDLTVDEQLLLNYPDSEDASLLLLEPNFRFYYFDKI